jgi:hypothetical protein
MLSVKTMGLMAAIVGGGALAGYAGWKKSGSDGMDFEDRAAFTTSSIVAGMVGGAVLKGIGLRGIGAGLGILGKGAKYGYKAATFHPTAGLVKALDATKAGATLMGGLRYTRKTAGALGLLTAGTVGAVAYGARSNPKATMALTPNGYEDAQSVRERSALIGATGEMVFGLNNTRHG